MNKNIELYAFADESDSRINGQIAAMQRNGLNGLEIRDVEGVNISDISLEKAKEVRKKLDDAGLITWSIGSPIGKINIETDDFSSHLEKFRHTLDLADALGAQNIRMFSFYIPNGKDPADYKNEVIDRLGRFLAVAKSSGVALCHENEKGIYGDNAARCLELFKAVPELKGIFDPANFVQCGQETLEAWKLLKSYIKYMHIKDALPNGSVVPAGHGAGNLKAIVSDYLSEGGTHFTIEPHLAIFDALKTLEREGEESEVGKELIFESKEAAFDAACSAFKLIL